MRWRRVAGSLATAVAGGAAAIAANALLADDGHVPDTANSRPTGHSTPPQDLDDLRARIRRLEADQRQPTPVEAVRDDDETGRQESAGQVDDHSISIERERERITHKTAFLETEFLNEPSDVDWAGETESFMWSRGSKIAAPGTEILAVDCAATMCRFEAEHQEAGAHRPFMLRFIFEMGERLQHAHVVRDTTEDGRVLTRGFMARPGYRLPKPGKPEVQ